MNKNFSKKFDYAIEQTEVSILWDKISNEPSSIDLTISNPTSVGLELDLRQYFNPKIVEKFSQYSPTAKGNFELRNEIAKCYSKYGRIVNPEDIFLTSGSSEAISFLLKLYCNPNDKVLVPIPGYPLFEYLVELESLNIEYYRNTKLDLLYDTNDAKIIFIVQPSNPCGTILSSEEILQMEELCRNKNLIAVVDEVFIDYSNHSPKEIDCNSIYIGGFSKSLGLPQLKISWLYFKGTKEFKKSSIERMEIITDTYLSVNQISQTIGIELLKNKSKFTERIQTRIQNNLNFIEKRLTSKVNFQKYLGGWSLVLQGKEISDENTVLTLIKEKKILVHPGYLFGFETANYLVISLLPEEKKFMEGIERLNEFFSV
ncbi:MAG: pyridoxal phosphate-dependent aminotransferase [Leptospiraceae bacterium]|nr:pyridoxal phosphate-dependent aminotransferase [Leptospiraceae bacterium]